MVDSFQLDLLMKYLEIRGLVSFQLVIRYKLRHSVKAVKIYVNGVQLTSFATADARSKFRY